MAERFTLIGASSTLLALSSLTLREMHVLKEQIITASTPITRHTRSIFYLSKKRRRVQAVFMLVGIQPLLNLRAFGMAYETKSNGSTLTIRTTLSTPPPQLRSF